MEPEHSSSSINIPIRISDLRQRGADLCSCVLEVAPDSEKIHRIRTYLEEAENEFVEFSACTKCGGCHEFQATEGFLDDIYQFSVKLANDIQARNESDRVLQIKGNCFSSSLIFFVLALYP